MTDSTRQPPRADLVTTIVIQRNYVADLDIEVDKATERLVQMVERRAAARVTLCEFEDMLARGEELRPG